MGQVLHGSATTTEAIRRAIQHSQESRRALARRYGVNPKTVTKWKQRSSVADQPTGPEQPHSTALSIKDEAIRRRLSRAHPVAARRLPLCAAGYDPAPDPLVVASLPTTPRHLPPARAGRHANRQEEVQDLPNRLFSHRHWRSPHRVGKALPACRHRPNIEVRLRRIARKGHAACRRRFPPQSHRSRSLSGPHRADR